MLIACHSFWYLSPQRYDSHRSILIYISYVRLVTKTVTTPNHQYCQQNLARFHTNRVIKKSYPLQPLDEHPSVLIYGKRIDSLFDIVYIYDEEGEEGG